MVRLMNPFSSYGIEENDRGLNIISILDGDTKITEAQLEYLEAVFNTIKSGEVAQKVDRFLKYNPEVEELKATSKIERLEPKRHITYKQGFSDDVIQKMRSHFERQEGEVYF